MNYAEFEDVSKVEKYVMSDAEYDKREDSYRNFRKKMLAKDPNWTPFGTCTPQLPVDHLKEEADKIKVGDRCETTVGARRGEVKYVGKVTGFQRGYWVGI